MEKIKDDFPQTKQDQEEHPLSPVVDVVNDPGCQP